MAEARSGGAPSGLKPFGERGWSLRRSGLTFPVGTDRRIGFCDPEFGEVDGVPGGARVKTFALRPEPRAPYLFDPLWILPNKSAAPLPMTRHIPKRRHRRSIRLQGYDSIQPGVYFVTIFTHNREPLFGQVMDGEMVLNALGRMAWEEWSKIPDHFPLLNWTSSWGCPITSMASYELWML